MSFFVSCYTRHPRDAGAKSLSLCGAYLDWAIAVCQGLRGVNPWLEARFDEAAEQLGRSLPD